TVDDRVTKRDVGRCVTCNRGEPTIPEPHSIEFNKSRLQRSEVESGCQSTLRSRPCCGFPSRRQQDQRDLAASFREPLRLVEAEKCRNQLPRPCTWSPLKAGRQRLLRLAGRVQSCPTVRER